MKSNEIKALITGGVSGLGLAVARKVVALGGQAVLLDINDEAAATVVAELGDAVSYIRTDVSSEQEVQDAVAAAVERMGAINAAVNCAGIIGAARVLGREAPMPLEFFSRVIQVNLIGSFNICKAAGAAMEANEPGPDGERAGTDRADLRVRHRARRRALLHRRLPPRGRLRAEVMRL